MKMKSLLSRWPVDLMTRQNLILALATLVLVVFFMNCSQPGQVNISERAIASETDLSVCNGISCTLEPLTDKVAVTTILLALGDETNNQLVINGGSSQLIAETVVRYTTPVKSPKILVVRDHKTQGETDEDTVYVSQKLLARYAPDFLAEPTDGIGPNDIAGYDLVWFNNPGYPMSTKRSYETLLNFNGGVVLQGDDLSQGAGFSIEKLTRLKFIDNGGSVVCDDGVTYAHDNNAGNQFRVSMDASKMPSNLVSNLQFKYGNDIDNTAVSSGAVEILASAYGGPATCHQARPTIVRYFKSY